MADLLIRHAHVITMDDAGTQVVDGAVAITGRRITAVGPDAEVARTPAARVIDARGGPLHPGLVETHLHASYHTYRGVVPDAIREVDVFPTIEVGFYGQVTEEDEELSGLLASMEMVRNGTTCFMEAGTFLFPDAAARAATTVGIRALLGDTVINDDPGSFAMGKDEPRADAGFIGRAPRNLDEALAALGGQLARNDDPDSLVRGHIAVLGLGTASEALLLEAKRRARAAGVVLNMHHAYSVADTEADRRRYGKDPVLHFAEIGVLDRWTTLGHANHLTDPEAEALLATGTSLAWAPAASMLWGHGGARHSRHAELWRRGVNVGLGSDSANWSNSFDLFRQANLAILMARDGHEDREYLYAEDGLRMATRGGARAVGLDAEIGSIEVGKRADLVLHTLDRPELRPTSDMVRNLMLASGSRAIRSVIVDGRVVLDEGRFPHLDERALLDRIDTASHHLWERMGYRPYPERRPAASTT
jgi:cytosine/adenosine deaminase-related metal-dependent hydrolase